MSKVCNFNTIYQLDIRSIGTVINLTTLNTRYSLLIDGNGFNLYNIRLTCVLS